jgi:hypothetical protein
MRHVAPANVNTGIERERGRSASRGNVRTFPQ